MTAPRPYEMTWDARQPMNLSYSRPTGFNFQIMLLPTVSYFCQSITLPGVSIGRAIQANPLLDLKWPGEKLTYQDLYIKFIVQNDFANFIELYKWFIGIGAPTNNEQYTAWLDAHAWSSPIAFPDQTGQNRIAGQFSDATLSIFDGTNNVAAEWEFKNLFPTSMSGVPFDLSKGNTQYLTCEATFAYEYYMPKS